MKRAVGQSYKHWKPIQYFMGGGKRLSTGKMTGKKGTWRKN
jgi:hypothetical protein